MITEPTEAAILAVLLSVGVLLSAGAIQIFVRTLAGNGAALFRGPSTGVSYFQRRLWAVALRRLQPVPRADRSWAWIAVNSSVIAATSFLPLVSGHTTTIGRGELAFVLSLLSAAVVDVLLARRASNPAVWPRVQSQGLYVLGYCVGFLLCVAATLPATGQGTLSSIIETGPLITKSVFHAFAFIGLALAGWLISKDQGRVPGDGRLFGLAATLGAVVVFCSTPLPDMFLELALPRHPCRPRSATPRRRRRRPE